MAESIEHGPFECSSFIVGIFWQWVAFHEIRSWRVTFAAHDSKDALYAVMSGYAILSWHYSLFINLWRKGGKK